MVVRAFINKETLKYLREHIGITLPYIEKITKCNENKYLQWEDVNSCDFPTCLQAKKNCKMFSYTICRFIHECKGYQTTAYS